MENYIFDFDGTLADSELCSVLATQKAFKECGLNEVTEEKIRYYMGIPIEKSFKEMADKELSPEEFEKLLAIFRKNYQELENETLKLFPEMAEVLEQLHTEGKACFVVSSKKSDVLLRNLKALGINHYFKDLVGSDKVSHYKPHPEGIELLVEAYQLDKAATVMIGDAIFDIQMGQAAGCKSCGVTWGSHGKAELLAENPDYCVNQVRDLLSL